MAIKEIDTVRKGVEEVRESRVARVGHRWNIFKKCCLNIKMKKMGTVIRKSKK
jgi:hypothetical protein